MTDEWVTQASFSRVRLEKLQPSDSSNQENLMNAKLRLLAIAFGGAMTFTSLMAGSNTALAGLAYDGTWSVKVFAQAEECSLTRTLRLRVADGRVSWAGLFGPRAQGQVHQDGQIRIRLSHAGEVVDATGALAGRSGGGSWKSPTLHCGGTWKAMKA